MKSCGVRPYRMVTPEQGSAARSSPPPPPSAAAASPCSVPGCTACWSPRRSLARAPSGPSPTTRRPTRPAGTAAAARARRSGSRCSATPAPPATAWSASRTPRAPSWPAASPTQADRRVHLREHSRWSARSPATSPARSTPPCPTDPDLAVILIGANDVTHTVLPVAVGAPPLRGRTPPARRRRRGAGGHVPRPRHDQARSPRRSSRSPARGRAGSRPHRRSPWSRPAGGPSRSARSSAPSSSAAPALLFGPDQFHPSADGYRQLAAVLIPSTPGRPRPRSRRTRRCRRPTAARASCRSRPPPCAPSTHPGHRARRHRGVRLPAGPARALGRAAPATSPPPPPRQSRRRTPRPSRIPSPRPRRRDLEVAHRSYQVRGVTTWPQSAGCRRPREESRGLRAV